MPASTYNPERPRCSWCDAPFRNNADLIAHQAEHRDGLSLQDAVNRARTMIDDLVGIGTVTARMDEEALRTLIDLAERSAAYKALAESAIRNGFAAAGKEVVL